MVERLQPVVVLQKTLLISGRDYDGEMLYVMLSGSLQVIRAAAITAASGFSGHEKKLDEVDSLQRELGLCDGSAPAKRSVRVAALPPPSTRRERRAFHKLASLLLHTHAGGALARASRASAAALDALRIRAEADDDEDAAALKRVFQLITDASAKAARKGDDQLTQNCGFLTLSLIHI